MKVEADFEDFYSDDVAWFALVSVAHGVGGGFDDAQLGFVGRYFVEAELAADGVDRDGHEGDVVEIAFDAEC